MISRSDLKKISKARLRDAKILLGGKRFEGAIYLCGYAIELALKARICQTLRWPEFPSTAGEFNNYKSFRSHDLEVLLHLSGIESKIKTTFLGDWSTVAQWDPDSRYKAIGTATRSDADQMISAAVALVKKI